MPIKTGADMVAEAKGRIHEVSVQEVLATFGTPDAPVLLDVREPNETNLGRIPGAIVLVRGNLETRIEALVPRDAAVVIYCATGNRSALAADTLQQMGYTNVASMAGGWVGWVGADGPVDD
jgi:rhodanese-related sulfurtransferase